MKKNITQILFFSIPSFFSKGVSLLLVPLYVTNLSVAEFGTLELITFLGLFLQYLLHLGWGSAYTRYYKEETVNLPNLVFTLFCFRMAIACFVAFLVLIIGIERLSLLITGSEQYKMAILGSIVIYLAREFLLFFETKYRMETCVWAFMFLNVGVSILQLILIPIFLLYYKQGVTSIVWGQVTALLCFCVFMLLHDSQWLWAGSYNSRLLKQILKFGLPLVPASIAMFVVSGSDRYMLSWLLGSEQGLEQVACYSLAYKFIMILSLASSGFSVFWSPYVFSTYRIDHAKDKYVSIYRNYVLFLFIVSALFLLTLPFIYKWFEEYRSGLSLCPLLLSGFLIYQVGDYFCIGIDLKEKTQIRAFAGLLTAIVNIGLNLLLIPKYQAAGASFATLCSYICYVSILMFYSHRLYAVNYAWGLWVAGALGLVGFKQVYNAGSIYHYWYGGLVIGLIILLYLGSGFLQTWRSKRYGVH